jgi:prolyl-tRNA editing enzyme YbaK/EbsC (Cys-tRNA(Pro) deacylase)
VAAPADFPDTVVFPSETRTAADAAAAIGCEVAAIVKSLVCRRGTRARACPRPLPGLWDQILGLWD